MTADSPIDPDLAERLRPFASELRSLADHLEATPKDSVPTDPKPGTAATGRTEITEDLMSELRAERDAARAARHPAYIETQIAN